MGIKWTEALSVGVKMIDDEHIEMFEKVDQLFEAGKRGKAKEEISELLNFLDAYTKKHFGDEEKYMLNIKYPAYDTQKKLHIEFIEQIGKLKKEYGESGSNITVIINANQMVVDWLIKHISFEDKKIGAYAKSLNA